jgi:RNA polymerase sigma-70 factor (ECF subfamily)
MHADQLLEHGVFLRSLAAGLLRGEEGVDDVVQEAYLRALKHRPRHPRSWMGKVVRNLVFRAGRSRKRRLRREIAVARSESQPDTTKCIERLELQRKVVEAVLDLQEPYRSAIVQRYLDDVPPKEIARRSGIPYETVRTRLGRALRELRRRLDSEHASWAPALALLVLRPSRLSVMGGVAMSSVQSKTLMASMAVLGVGVGVAGHAAFIGFGEGGTMRAPAAVREGSFAPEVAALRAQAASLRREMDQLRSRDGAVGTFGGASGSDASASDPQRARQALEGLLAIEEGERQLAIKWAFENLVKQGDAVVPEIVALLKTDRDRDYGGRFASAGNMVTSYPRLRTVLIDVLRQIGSPLAKDGLLEAIRGSNDPLDHKDMFLLYYTTADEKMVTGISELMPKVLELVERDRDPSFTHYVNTWIGKHNPPGGADMLGRLTLTLLREGGIDYGAFRTLLDISPDKALQVAERLHKENETALGQVASSLMAPGRRLSQVASFYEAVFSRLELDDDARVTLYSRAGGWRLCASIKSKEERAADGRVALEFLLRRQREEASDAIRARLKYPIDNLKKQIVECEKR